MSARGVRRALGASALWWACTTHAAIVVFTDGWMRPVSAGAASADAYVDVRADAALAIVGVRTGIARAVELVAAPAPADGNAAASATRDARHFMLAPGEKLRFARHGNVLRLHDITRSVSVGDTVRLEFAFEDARRHPQAATATIVVRGVLPPAPAGATGH